VHLCFNVDAHQAQVKLEYSPFNKLHEVRSWSPGWHDLDQVITSA